MGQSDYQNQAPVYDKGRQLAPETIAVWMDAARTVVTDLRVKRILDVGSGTGRFSSDLARAFGARVVAVEPSKEMQREAALKSHPDVSLVAGSAEWLPIADASCDVAWLSNVIHHVNMTVTAIELRRVVPASGVVLVRGHLKRGHTYSLYRYFTDSQASLALEDITEDAIEQLRRAEFSSCRAFGVQQLTAVSLRELYERARHRADSALQRLTDDAFDEGLARLEAAAAEDTGPVVDEMELLAFS